MWNAYNRLVVAGLIGDTNIWNYSTATWRAADNSTSMRVSFVQGLQEEYFHADYVAMSNDSSTGQFAAGIGYDSTSAPSDRTASAIATSSITGLPAGGYDSQSLGYHYMQAIEITQVSGGTMSWYGTATPGTNQTGIRYSGVF